MSNELSPRVREALERFEKAHHANSLGARNECAAEFDRQALRIIRDALERGAIVEAMINSPETASFLLGVQLETAHQIEKWGEAHDRGKSAENWFWLVGYLAGKCLRAAITGDKTKALHHTISAAAACANWHKAISRDETGCGIGHDNDIKPIELERFEGVDIDRVHHSRADREYVHHLGGSGHGGSVPI